MMVLMAYLIFGLGVGFGEQTGYIILLIAIGLFYWSRIRKFCWKMFLSFKKKILKHHFYQAFTDFIHSFSGMMIIDIKHWMQTNLPILTYVVISKFNY